MAAERSWFTELNRYLGLYSSGADPRHLTVVRHLLVAMAIDNGYGPAELEILFRTLDVPQPA